MSKALDYHKNGRPGKIAIEITKSSVTQEDLSLAYTPGVAEPVLAIAADPLAAYDYTATSNLVGIITDGSAILGLGNRGPKAAKPVMEGKAVLFKQFADVDVFDLEMSCQSPAEFIQAVKAVSPTFGAICLEDIKAPECFEIEAKLIEALDIPVMHDDQHGTAVIVAAALMNAIELQGKQLKDLKIACLGAGAAGIACMDLLREMGADKEQIYVVDRQGLITSDRSELPPHKRHVARDCGHQSLMEVLTDADVFVGVSGPGLLTEDHLKKMAKNPIIFALSNPEPEISPAMVAEARPDAIMATGRSDFPNQVNNALVFPYLFRGALDTHASSINTEMKLAAVQAIQSLAKEPVPASVKEAYPECDDFEFGPNYIIPKCLDERLKERVTSAVVQAAIDSGVSRI